jgi:hypothetical protein
VQWLNKHVWKPDWGTAWGWTKLASGAIVLGFHSTLTALSPVINSTEVKSSLEALHLDPKIGLGLAVLGAITLIAASHE